MLSCGEGGFPIVSRHPLHHCHALGIALKGSSINKTASPCYKVANFVYLRGTDGLHPYLGVALPRLVLLCA